MITLLLIILGAIIGLCIYKAYRAAKDEPYSDESFMFGTAAVCLGFVWVGIGFWWLCEVGGLVDLSVIDERIAIYEERNQSINTALAEMVDAYMNYETDTYERAKLGLDSLNVVVAIQAYPELNAMPLVQQQVNTFMENEKEITKLKEEKLSQHSKQWWLSFGLFGGND